MLQKPMLASALFAGLLALAAGGAQAFGVVSVSPRGEVAQVRQVVVKFDAAAVDFGDPKAPAPYAVGCSDAQAAQGQARWLSAREWAWDFAQDLPPGVRCEITPRAGFKPASGAAWAAPASYRFNTGGPAVQRTWPQTWGAIEEGQYFILQLNGAATADSVREHVWCDLDGVGERVPVKMIEGKDRETLLRARRLWDDAQKEPLRYPVLACARRATAGSHLQLVYDKGVQTASGVANHVVRRFKFRVREAFSADFSCERENAHAACLPIRPMRLGFSAPLTRKTAMAVRLKGGGQTLSPHVDDHEGGASDDLVQAVVFSGPFAPETSFTLELPEPLQDASGRTLENAQNFPLKVATGPMPPLVKFAAAPFGIIERYAEGPDGPALLPVTVRRVEQQLKVQDLQPGATAGQVSTLTPTSDAEIIAWLSRVQRFESMWISRKDAQADVEDPLPPPARPAAREDGDKGAGTPDEHAYVQARRVSLLAGRGGVKTLALPDVKGGDPAYNAGRLRELLDGAKTPYRDIVLLNAAAAFIVAGRADSLKLGVSLAAQEIDSGRAKATLDKLIAVSNS